jgi:uncharacterized Zn finger protein
MSYYYGWKPYVSVAQRRAQALREMGRLRKKGVDIQPVEIEGRKIAATFWGEAWCSHMESQGDFANRLPRGRTYVRNGSVCHLAIEKGQVQAKVSGSEIYDITIKIDVLPKAKWKKVQQHCSGQIGTLLELLQGRISDSVMEVVTDPKSGLFPRPAEIHLDCDCPDYAMMCKHLAAVLYGIGARLDSRPELLFLLRGVDHSDLVTATSDDAVIKATKRGGRRRKVAESELADVFGIDLDGDDAAETDSMPSSRSTSRKKKPKREKAKTPQAKKKTAKRPGTKAVKPKKGKRARAAAEPKPLKKKKQAEKKTRGKAKKSVVAASANEKSAKRPKRAAKKKGTSAKLAKRAAAKSGKRKRIGKKKEE